MNWKNFQSRFFPVTDKLNQQQSQERCDDKNIGEYLPCFDDKFSAG
jgi:hypothetical protein